MWKEPVDFVTKLFWRNYRKPQYCQSLFEIRTRYLSHASQNTTGSLSSRHGASSDCGRRRRPPDMESSCENIE